MNRIAPLMVSALVGLVLLSACQPQIPRPHPTPTLAVAATTAVTVMPTASSATPRPVRDQPGETGEAIHWYAWESATFALAQTQSKLILLDLTAVWCHWCHVMDETSYSDPTVIGLLNERYIPVRVDTDRRPDIQARYLMGGWPTTAILTAEGDILTGGTYIPPEELAALLITVNEQYAESRETVTQRIAELRQQVAEAGPEPVAEPFAAAREAALDRLAQTYDPVNGGFGAQPKFPNPDGVALMFRELHTSGEKIWRDRIRHTLNGMRKLVDLVWGGVFRYSVTADWETPHYEKLLSGNAQILQNYLEAYQVSGDPVDRATAEAILRYVEQFMWDTSGGFFGSQDADVVDPRTHELLVDGEEYFLLSEQQRLAVGIPTVDRTLYVNWNGQMIVALLEAASLLDAPRYRQMGLLAFHRLWAAGRGPDGQMWHSLYEEEGKWVSGSVATLNDQVHFGLASLAAYSATGERAYLQYAQALANYVTAHLVDPEHGGFFDLQADPSAPGTLSIQEVSCPDNIIAARFFTRLHRLTDDPGHRVSAESALKRCGGVYKEGDDGSFDANPSSPTGARMSVNRVDAVVNPAGSRSRSCLPVRPRCSRAW